jgi:transposase
MLINFLSVGIDAGADFSFMSIAHPNQTLIGKPIKILHSNMSSLANAVSAIRKAEDTYSMKSRIFIESTGIYHYPVFCYFRDRGFDIRVVNPIISNSTTNVNIRKAKNDKIDSKKLAFLGLNPKLKTSVMPDDIVINLRNLVREYYNLTDMKSAYTNKLHFELRTAFPQYIGIFSKLNADTSLELLYKYMSPKNFLAADKSELISTIRKVSRFGVKYAERKCGEIIQAAENALVFGHSVETNFTLIKLYIDFIRSYDRSADSVMSQIKNIINENPDELFIRQIHIVDSIRGAGLITAATIMCEIGDFSVFEKPKQLFAYFGLDPAVNQSGNSKGRDGRMSKRGSPLARRAIHTIALVSIGKNNNPVLRDYYINKCKSKPKLVALGAVSHKICNIIFAILRDNKNFSVISPDDHINLYQSKLLSVI